MTYKRHEVCRASAGTGKTYQLTARYLRLLRGGADPGTILATTFTRKAAGEILGRVFARLVSVIRDARDRARLAKEIAAPLTEADCRDMLRRVVEAMPRLAIGTLDSFFHRIAQCFALELALPPAAQLLDSRGPEATQLRLEAIEAMLGDDDLPAMLSLLRRVHHDAARRVTDAIHDVISDFHRAYLDAPRREQWILPPMPGLLEPDAAQHAIDALTAFDCDWPDNRWRTAFGKLIAAAHAGDWEAVITGGLGVKWPDDTYYGNPFPAPLAEVMHPIMLHARAAAYQRYADQTLAYYDLLRKFDGHYERLRAQRGAMLFESVTRKLAHVLPTLGDDVMLDVYYRLDGRVRHLLLDEFQDTNPDQWAILEPIAREVTSDESEDRSFYCVGDVKQAIHGWRGGCVELFGHIEQTLAGGIEPTPMDLSQRSSQVVLDAVNRVFTQLPTCAALADHTAVATEWAAQFAAHHTAHPARAGYVRLEVAPPDEDGDTAGGEGETSAPPGGFLQFVAQRVAKLHRADPRRSIGVLVERNVTVGAMLFELHRLGVDASAEGRSPIAGLPAVAAVLSALTWADHPGDRACAFHVARSPLGELVGLAQPDDAAAARVALQLRRRLIDEGYAAVIADWTRKLAPACDAAQLDGLEQLAELAERYEPTATTRASDFVRYVRGTDLARDSAARVRIVTIHGAKGLTFDAAVLAELDRGMDLSSKLLVDRDDPLSPVKSVCVAPKHEVRACFPALDAIAQRQARRELSEELCKLYVSMTRPKHGLYLFVRAQRKGARNLTSGRIVLQALTGQPRPPAEHAVLYESGNAGWMRHDRRDGDAPPAPQPPIRLNLRGGERTWTSVSPSSLEHGGRVSTTDLLRVRPHAGRVYGSRVHELLAAVEYLDESADFPEELREILERPTIRAVLSRNGATELWRERTFVVRDGDRLLRGTFDRVAFHAGGATIIDFKTDTKPDVDRYRPQVDAYRRALAKLRGLDPSAIACKLVFVGTGEVVAV